MLRSEDIEKESVDYLQRAYPEFIYDHKLTLYENYLSMASDLDCLAFRQIDEDIFKYEPNDTYLRDCQTSYERDLILRGEKSSLRNILRVLILWSKQSILEDQNGVISYGTGFLDMIQRLIAITNSEQECFSIIAGIIKAYPRPFTSD